MPSTSISSPRRVTTIPGAAGGKGSVSVKYGAESAKPALKAFVDAVMRRHQDDPVA